jgi:hypothetical protein
MSKKILLDKISIPGIKPMKYTVKRWLRSWKSYESNDSDEEVELKHLDFGEVVLVSRGLKWSY